MADSDVHGYLSGLLVTDRQGLTFLYQTVVGQGEATLEEMVGALSQHVASASRTIAPGLQHWLDNPTSLAPRHLARVIRLSGFYGDSDIVQPLRAILGQVGLMAVHPAAVRSLSQSVGLHAAAQLGEILWATPPRQWHVRETAILREFGELGWSSSIDDLVRALKVPYDNPVRAAAASLAKFEPEAVLPLLLPLIDGSQEGNVRAVAGAAEALGLLGEPQAVGPLQRAAQSENVRIACAAAVALVRLGEVSAAQHLIELASVDRGHRDAEERARALEGLGLLAEIGQSFEEDAWTALMAGLRDSQPEVRSAAALALGSSAHGTEPQSEMVDRAAVEMEEAWTAETSPLVQADMVRALGSLGHPRSIPQLLAILRSGKTSSLKIEVLDALGRFGDPALARDITPFRNHRDQELARAADRALRRLLYRPFSWPASEPTQAPVTLDLHSLEDARSLLLPPPEVSEPGFFERLFGSSTPEPEAAGQPVGTLALEPDGVRMTRSGEGPNQIAWARAFSTQITREPIGSQDETDDIGIHFTLRQRRPNSAAEFETVRVSLWCAPSEDVGALPVKSERLPCLNPHQAPAFLKALRYYAEVHGERLPMA